MPKLLFFAYPFPPSPAIGAVRAWSIAKYLSRAGWEVTVVTPRPTRGFTASAVAQAREECRNESIHVIHAGRLAWPSPLAAASWMEFVQRWTDRIFFRILRWIGVGPDELWLVPALTAPLHVQAGSFDLVLATGSPFSSFLAAWCWARKLRVPFVLDYRDPWSLNKLRSKPGRLIRRLEQHLVAAAVRLVMVSPSQAAQQQQAFNLDQRPLVLTNGFDPELLAKVTGNPFNEFSVVYAGEFYQGQREVDPLLVALKRTRQRGPKSGQWLRLHYYGSATDYVFAKARQIGVEELVVCHGRVPRSEVLAAIKGSDVAAVIAGSRDHADQLERGIVTGKLFEPLGLGVPVLLIAPEGSDASTIIQRAGAGKSFRASETEAMADWLLEVAEQPRGAFSYPLPKECSWVSHGQRLDRELRELIQFESANPTTGILS